MAAYENLQGEQLRMFIPARELVDPSKFDHYDVRYDPWNRSYDQIQEAKLAEAKSGGPEDSRKVGEDGDTLRESIKKNGIQTPVDMMVSLPGENHMMGNGHHRTFVANDLNPSMEIPVTWRDPFDLKPLSGPIGSHWSKPRM